MAATMIGSWPLRAKRGGDGLWLLLHEPSGFDTALFRRSAVDCRMLGVAGRGADKSVTYLSLAGENISALW